MVGVIDVGGGTRGIFGAGVFDRCMDLDIHFDFVAGVSAGSANGASYLAGQRGRNYVYYNDYAFRKEYMSLQNFVRTGSYINLDYIYSTLSNSGGEYPLDYHAMMRNPADLEIVATDALTGRPVYLHKKDIRENDYSFMKASCCVPGINRPFRLAFSSFGSGAGKNHRSGYMLCYDGGLSDPIPFRRALQAGCDKIVVILTRPKDEFRKGSSDHRLARMIRRKYPDAASAWERRSTVYNNSLRELLSLEKKGTALIIAPDTIGDLKTLSQDHEQLDRLYRKGYDGAARIREFLLSSLPD